MQLTKVSGDKVAEVASYMAEKVLENLRHEYYSPEDQLDALVANGQLTTLDKARIKKEIRNRLKDEGYPDVVL